LEKGKILLEGLQMNRLSEIDERLAAIREDIDTRGGELTMEALTAYESEVANLNAEADTLRSALDKRNAILSGIAEKRNGKVTRSFAGEATAADDATNSMEYRAAFMKYVLRGTPMPVEYRADAVTATTDVGAAIPETVLDRIIQKLETSGMILSRVTRTAYRGGLVIPTNSVRPVATWVAEGAGSDTQKQPVNGQITFNYYKLRCAVAVTLEVETMAISAFENLLVNNIAEAMVKALETAIISGTGTGQPKGILAETPATGQTLSVAAPSYATLTAAEAALPQPYENGAVWCMSKKTFMAFVAMTDSTGQPIARVNYGIGGSPERTLLGRTVVLCDYVDSYSATLAGDTVFAFLFNFGDYILNTNYGITVKRYEDNATDDQVTRAVMLVDGKVVDKNSLVTITMEAPPASA
jgi:HK97 family phage major capsid protein